ESPNSKQIAGNPAFQVSQASRPAGRSAPQFKSSRRSKNLTATLDGDDSRHFKGCLKFFSTITQACAVILCGGITRLPLTLDDGVLAPLPGARAAIAVAAIRAVTTAPVPQRHDQTGDGKYITHQTGEGNQHTGQDAPHAGFEYRL